MRFIPGPDLPTGGRIVGLDGIRDAYATGRGSFKTRAKVEVEQLSARRTGLVVTELPYMVGPEKVIEKIKDAVNAKKLTGISDVVDLTDRNHGLRLVIELKNGFNPNAVLQQLYRYSPMEDSFGINNVTLVDGQPQTLGLLQLLQVYVGAPPQRGAPPHLLPPGQEEGPPAPGGGPADRDRGHRRSHPDHPLLRRGLRGAGAAHVHLRPHRDPGQLHPGTAAAAADQVLPA